MASPHFLTLTLTLSEANVLTYPPYTEPKLGPARTRIYKRGVDQYRRKMKRSLFNHESVAVVVNTNDGTSNRKMPNFFFYVFRLQRFHWPNIQPLSQLFIFRFILFMFGPTCANIPLPSISLVVIIVSAQYGSMSCQTHAHHCMLISHGLLYMVMSKGLHVTDVFFLHVTGLCVACIRLVSVG